MSTCKCFTWRDNEGGAGLAKLLKVGLSNILNILATLCGGDEPGGKSI